MHPNNPKATVSNPAARVFKGDMEAFGKAKEFPYAATTYRLTEHFHYWTKHVEISTPSSSRSSSSRSARRWLRGEGHQVAGDKVKVQLQPRLHQGGGGGDQAYPAPQGRRKDCPPRRDSASTGVSRGWRKNGFITNTLTPFVGDGNTQTPEFKSFLVNVEKALRNVTMALQSLDIKPSARPRPRRAPPRRGKTIEVAKLIDVSKPASAARPARWRACSGTTCATKSVSCGGTYDNPTDMTDQSWTVMRYAEVESEDRGLEWLIRKDGCMHCEDPGCLKACPSPGAIIQVRQRDRGFPPGKLHRLRLLRDRLPVQRAAHLQEGQQGLQMHAVLRPRRGRAQEPACVKVCPTGSHSASAPRRT